MLPRYLTEAADSIIGLGGRLEVAEHVEEDFVEADLVEIDGRRADLDTRE